MQERDNIEKSTRKSLRICPLIRVSFICSELIVLMRFFENSLVFRNKYTKGLTKGDSISVDSIDTPIQYIWKCHMH